MPKTLWTNWPSAKHVLRAKDQNKANFLAPFPDWEIILQGIKGILLKSKISVWLASFSAFFCFVLLCREKNTGWVQFWICHFVFFSVVYILCTELFSHWSRRMSWNGDAFWNFLLYLFEIKNFMPCNIELFFVVIKNKIDAVNLRKTSKDFTILKWTKMKRIEKIKKWRLISKLFL